jgi:hypothetical protein
MTTGFRLLLITAAIGAMGASVSRAAAPEISDPSLRLIDGFNAPGQFPTRVTAANVNIQPQAGAEFDSTGEDVLKVQFPASGPIKWTSSRANSGDTSLSIGPAFPANPLSYPANAFVDNFQAMNGNGAIDPINPNSTDLTTLAWRVSNTTGALFASARHNGVDDGYLFGGTPVGKIYGVTYFAVTAGQGWAFSMVDGQFANGGAGRSDLQTGAAGSGGGLHEASFSVATAYLSYEGGWQGAWVQGGIDGPATFDSGAPGLDPSTVAWSGGTANITLPGVNSANDGMLFVAPSDGNSQTRIAAAFPNGSGGWSANVRLDEDADVTGNSILTAGNGFQFLYVPYTAKNLIGGLVAGGTGAPIKSAGDALFDVTRTSAGEYSLSVYEADGVTKKDENDGMIMLSVADDMAGAPGLADRTFLSYQYNSGSGNFVIQSRELLSIGGATPDDVFGNDFNLRDSNFYFTWVDFTNPLSLPGIPGDFDGDGKVDGLDLEVWKGAFATHTAGADANGDGDSDGDDFLVWQQNLGTGVPSGGSAAVPEPASLGLIAAAAAMFAGRRRR